MIKNFEAIGLNLYANFISLKEEKEILSNIEPSTKINKGSDRNSIRRYGSNVPYKNQMESKGIPDFLETLCYKLVNEGYLPEKPDSVSINEYCIGNRIAAHIDSLASGEIISVLSLLSDATMVFSNDFQDFTLNIPRLSLVQMRNEIRYKWKHAILPVSNKRYSIVFRKGTTH
jgi:alkylated DNA repair dioxygenase AlkB